MAKLSQERKLHYRCKTLADILRVLAPIYADSNRHETEIHFVETILGAAIWYLPDMKQLLWTGHISRTAVESFHPSSSTLKPTLTADHEYPRKLAAIELLKYCWKSDPDPPQTVYELYISKYGRFNYLTPRENKVLVNYQKKGVFTDSSTAYTAAKVSLLTLTWAELTAVKKRDPVAISAIIQRGI